MKKQLAYFLACACLFWACEVNDPSQKQEKQSEEPPKTEKSTVSRCTFKKDPNKRMDNTLPFSKATKIEAISFDFDKFMKENRRTYDGMKGATKLENGVLQVPYITQRRFLSKEETVKLFEILMFNHGELSAQAKCHNPHNVFVFYEGDKPFAFLEICFECHNWRTVGCEFDEFCDEKWEGLKTFFPTPKYEN